MEHPSRDRLVPILLSLNFKITNLDAINNPMLALSIEFKNIEGLIFKITKEIDSPLEDAYIFELHLENNKHFIKYIILDHDYDLSIRERFLKEMGNFYKDITMFLTTQLISYETEIMQQRFKH